MNLLAAKLYDPAAAVSKATSALLAMTAFDTANLRLAVTVPAHGMVRFRLRCMLEGATTFPAILLGVLNGATVVGRVSPVGAPDGTALATTFCTQDAEFTATGLTPGAANFDAAYGVETIVAATNIKYGGPNDTTANNAFGGFVFEAWDPQPQQTTGQLVVDANGRVDVSKVLGATINALIAGRVDVSVGAMAANVMTAAAAAADLTTELQTGLATAAALATVQADTDDIQTRLPAALVSGRIDASVGAMAADVITASALATAAAQEVADALLDRAAAVEGFTPREILRLYAAALLGKADGLGTATAHYRNVADSKNRITATVDADGNRTVVTLDAT